MHVRCEPGCKIALYFRLMIRSPRDKLRGGRRTEPSPIIQPSRVHASPVMGARDFMSTRHTHVHRFHYAAGVDQITVYDDDSVDKTKEILQPFIKAGLVKYVAGKIEQ